MKLNKILFISIFALSFLFISFSNNVNASCYPGIEASTLTYSMKISYYDVPSTITREVGLRNRNPFPVQVNLEASSTISSLISFHENNVIIQPNQEKWVYFDVSINQQRSYSGTITSFFSPAPGYCSNIPQNSVHTSVTISKGTIVCDDGDTEECTTSDGCPGTKTCQSNTWSDCMKDDPDCGEEEQGCTEPCTEWSECIGGWQSRTCPCGGMENRPCSSDCTENWQCTEWSTCVNNQQTRTCTDQNNCGTTYDKPDESQSCTLNNETCTESWSCTDWGACQSSNTQTRTCTDQNNCGTTYDKPDESQSCTYTAPTSGGGGGGSSGGSSGGGGGGSPSGTTSTSDHEITEDQFEKGHEITLRLSQRAGFTINGEKHTLWVREVSTNDVRITLMSNIINRYMDKGEERNFDLNGDGSFDLYLKVIDIDKPVNKVTFLIRQYIKEEKQEVEDLETIESNETKELNETLMANNTLEELEESNYTAVPEVTGFAVSDIFNFSSGNSVAKIFLISIGAFALAAIAFVSFKRLNH